MHLDPCSLVATAAPLASLPAVHLRLSKALANPKVSATAIAEIISEDTGLAARGRGLLMRPSQTREDLERLTDMEGPSVKWFLTASPISRSMLTFEQGPR